jgi:hypothetical protein
VHLVDLFYIDFLNMAMKVPKGEDLLPNCEKSLNRLVHNIVCIDLI